MLLSTCEGKLLPRNIKGNKKVMYKLANFGKIYQIRVCKLHCIALKLLDRIKYASPWRKEQSSYLEFHWSSFHKCCTSTLGWGWSVQCRCGQPSITWLSAYEEWGTWTANQGPELCHMTRILASYLSMVVKWPEYLSLIGHLCFNTVLYFHPNRCKFRF